MSVKHRILLKGPFLSMSGYGYQARFALEAIRSREDLFDIYIENLGWGQTSWIGDNKLRSWIEEKIKKTLMYAQNGGQFDVNLQVTIPNEIQKHAPINILYTAGIETTQVSPEWLEACNQLNKMIVVSNHSKQIFENSQYEKINEHNQTVGWLRCQVPVDAVNYPVENITPAKLDLDLDYDFNFLTMAQWGPRKDLDNLITQFLEEFWEDEVGLVVKTFAANNSLSDRRKTEQRVKSLLNKVALTKDERRCKLYLLHGTMTKGELHGLYNHPNVGAFITSTHGEGFGLSIFESAYSGLPVVAPGWSGQCDYLFKGEEKLFTDIDFTLKRVQPEAVWDTVIQKDSSWLYVKNEDFRQKMRHVMENHDDAVEKARELKEYLHEEFTKEKKYDEFVQSILDVLPDNDLTDDEIDDWLNDMGVDLIEAE